MTDEDIPRGSVPLCKVATVLGVLILIPTLVAAPATGDVAGFRARVADGGILNAFHQFHAFHQLHAFHQC